MKISHIINPFFNITSFMKSYSPEQNGALCNFLASCKPAKTFILKVKCSAFTKAYEPGGLRGEPSPSQILGNSDFLGGKRNLGKPVFKEVSMFLFYYFEEMDIFYFNLKSTW